MKMECQDLPEGVTRIVLAGDLDASGASEIDLQLQEVATSRPKLVVDMEQVGFLASIGIRTLIQAVKANSGNGGKAILLAPNAAVWSVIVTCGADTTLPAAYDFDAAIAALS